MGGLHKCSLRDLAKSSFSHVRPVSPSQSDGFKGIGCAHHSSVTEVGYPLVQVSVDQAGRLPGEMACVEFNWDAQDSSVCLDTRPCFVDNPEDGAVTCAGANVTIGSLKLAEHITYSHGGQCFTINIHEAEVVWVQEADPPAHGGKDGPAPLGAGKIVGIIIAVLVALFVAGFAVWWWLRRPKRGPILTASSSSGAGYARFTSSTAAPTPPLAGASGYQTGV